MHLHVVALCYLNTLAKEQRIKYICKIKNVHDIQRGILRINDAGYMGDFNQEAEEMN